MITREMLSDWVTDLRDDMRSGRFERIADVANAIDVAILDMDREDVRKLDCTCTTNTLRVCPAHRIVP